MNGILFVGSSKVNVSNCVLVVVNYKSVNISKIRMVSHTNYYKSRQFLTLVFEPRWAALPCHSYDGIYVLPGL